MLSEVLVESVRYDTSLPKLSRNSLKTFSGSFLSSSDMLNFFHLLRPSSPNMRTILVYCIVGSTFSPAFSLSFCFKGFPCMNLVTGFPVECRWCKCWTHVSGCFQFCWSVFKSETVVLLCMTFLECACKVAKFYLVSLLYLLKTMCFFCLRGHLLLGLVQTVFCRAAL